MLAGVSSFLLFLFWKSSRPSDIVAAGKVDGARSFLPRRSRDNQQAQCVLSQVRESLFALQFHMGQNWFPIYSTYNRQYIIQLWRRRCSEIVWGCDRM